MSGGGAVPWTQPGYDEPPRDQEGANHMNTDYAQAQKSRQNRVFKDRRAKDRKHGV